MKKGKALFQKQRELLKRFIIKTRSKTLKDTEILRIITKIYSKKILSKKELDTLKKPVKKPK